jgi:hypothetical protein
MSILDDVFNAAAAEEPAQIIRIWVSITLSPSSIFPGTEPPGDISLGWGQLQFTPGEVIRLGQFGFHDVPAFFEGHVPIVVDQQQQGPEPTSTPEQIGLQITAPVPLGAPRNYNVAITFPGGNSVSFTPEIDPTTNVVYGAAGANFIVVSLSGPLVQPIVQ